MEEPDKRPTQYQICLWHTRADRVFKTIISQQLEPFRISLMEWLLLGVVRDADKTGLTLSQIAEALDVSQPQVTALMDKVSRQTLVRQKTLKEDRRSRSVVLSARGLRLMDKVEETVQAYMDEWLSQVPPEQFDTYLQTVQRIARFKLNG